MLILAELQQLSGLAHPQGEALALFSGGQVDQHHYHHIGDDGVKIILINSDDENHPHHLSLGSFFGLVSLALSLRLIKGKNGAKQQMNVCFDL